MVKRLFKVYFFKHLRVKSKNSEGVVSFLGIDYKKFLSIKLMLKGVLGLNFFGARLLCQQFNIPCRFPLNFFNDVQLVELKVQLFSGSFLSSWGGFKNNSNYVVASLWQKTKKEYLLKISQIGFLRAARLRIGLPVRGQRTKTNAQTSRSSSRRAF
jgi:ribosomal protein S13